ncbi:helix-turn-helix domain-containing protein [Corynebacterium striatum]|nr:DNA-binding protein [Corynebacterium striatum]
MPPADELATTLRNIANHMATLQTNYWESGLHAARQSQTGVRANTTGPSSPGDDTQLDYLQDIQQRLAELATNISEDLTILIPHAAKAGGFWAAWMYRHQHQLPHLTWYEDLAQELADLESELATHIHPTQPHTINLPDYATAEEIAKALGKKPDTIRKWCKRHSITAYTQNGKVHYKTFEITQSIT